MPGKKSIFNDGEEEEEDDDMNAPGMEQEDEEIINSTGASEPKKFATNTFFIGSGNNRELVTETAETNHEFVEGTKVPEKARLIWVQTPKEFNFFTFKEGKQLVNHIFNSRCFTNKMTTVEALETLDLSLNIGEIQSEIFKKSTDFFLETYRLT
jgi:hypothetical protein